MTMARHVLTAVMAAAAVIGAAAALPSAATEDEAPGDLHPGEAVTIAGTGGLGVSPDGTPALEAELREEMGLAVAPDGMVVIANQTDDRVQTVGTDGLLGSVPELSGGESADGGSYTHVWAVAVAADSSLYAATDDGLAVRRPDGSVETINAGDFVAQDIAVGADGTVYVADLPNSLIRAVDPAGAVTTLAGGDGSVREPRSIAVDSTGVVYYTDTTDEYDDSPSLIRRIDLDGTVSTVTGAGGGFAGDGGPAAEAQVSGHLGGLAIGPDDTLYVADTGNEVIRAIDGDGVITTVHSVLPSLADFDGPAPRTPEVGDLSFGPNGYLYATVGGMVRMIDLDPAAAAIDGDEGDDDGPSYDDPWAGEEFGSVVTVAGADGELPIPARVAVDEAGVVYVVEAESTDLLRLDADGTPEPVPVGPAGKPLTGVRAVDPGADGTVHVSGINGLDTVYPDGARVHHAGGIGGGHDLVSGAPATTVSTANWDLTTGPEGLYFADAGVPGVYVVAADGTLTTVGTGVDAQYAGGIDVADDGTVYVAENRLDQVSAISPDGTSSVIAGNGETSWMNDEIGDGGPATDAVLARPTDVAVAADGRIYVSSVHGIRRIDDDGTIVTILEDEAGGEPSSLDFDSHGNLYFTELRTGLVRVLVRPGEISGPFPWVVVGPAAGAAAVVALVTIVVVRRRRVA